MEISPEGINGKNISSPAFAYALVMFGFVF